MGRRKEADLNGERIAEEVGESSDGREHGALHELPRPVECLPQVLPAIIARVPPLLWFFTHRAAAHRSPPQRISGASPGDGEGDGAPEAPRRGDGQLAASGGLWPW